MESERAPLIRSYVQGLPSIYTESVGNFYSPMASPEGSIFVAESDQLEIRSVPLTPEQVIISVFIKNLITFCWDINIWILLFSLIELLTIMVNCSLHKYQSDIFL